MKIRVISILNRDSATVSYVAIGMTELCALCGDSVIPFIGLFIHFGKLKRISFIGILQ
jgi:hypothetical protein